MHCCGIKWIIVEYGGGWCISICMTNCLCVYKCGCMRWFFCWDFIPIHSVTVKHIFIDILLTFRFNRWHVAHNVLWYRRYNVHFQRPSNRFARRCRASCRIFVAVCDGIVCWPRDNRLLTPHIVSHAVTFMREYINKKANNINNLVSVCLNGRGLCDKDCRVWNIYCVINVREHIK